MKIDKCALFIISCDAYADLWRPFFTLLDKYWPDCPFPMYLGTNQEGYSNETRFGPLKILRAGPDIDYATTIRRQLEQLKEPYFLNMNADFFLTRPVNTPLAIECFRSLLTLKGDYLRLVPWPKPDLKVKDYPLIGRIKPGAPYRTSLQSAIWRKETFVNLTLDGEKTWDFENTSPDRSTDLPGFYSTWEQLIPYDHDVVVKGKWMRSQARRYRKMDIGCDFTKRPIMTRWETISYYWVNLLSALRNLIPWEWRRWLRERMV